METILITNDAKIARCAEESGVDRIMVDLEILGKKDRQGHLNTVISEHTLEDIIEIKKVLNKTKLLVRINPINRNSKQEIEKVINNGAEIIMLPMFKTKKEVETFVSLVRNRAKKTLLLETPEALVRIDDILEVEGIDEIHIGLNDLHLGMNLKFMFELLSGGIVEYLSKKIRSKGIVFGFGGIARLGQGLLDSSLILSEHFRLGSEVVILSRDFKGGAENYEELIQKVDLKSEIDKILLFLQSLESESDESLTNNKLLLNKIVNKIVVSKYK
jgi:hypothetical protein